MEKKISSEANAMKRISLLVVLLCVAVGNVRAQNPEGGPRNFPPGDMIAGKVTTVNKDSLVIAPLAGGDAITVKLSADTRITRQRQPIKLEEIKSEDVVFVRGEKKDNVVQATMVGVVPPDIADRLRQGAGGMFIAGGPGGPGGQQFNREDLGKKFIAGEVKAINETKLTIARPDGQTQDIEVDENTSFKKGNESVTLPDIKVGDFVFGPGELKESVFVAKTLNIGRGRMMRFRRGEGDQPEQKKPGDKPSGDGPPKY
jgi:hypothetical protein